MLALVSASLVAFAAAQAPAFTLEVIHASDNESALQDPNTLEERLLGHASVIEGPRTLEPDASIYVTVSDHTLPGPFCSAAAQVPELGAPGLGDIALFNAMGLVANGIGNHEFDGGLNGFAVMLNRADYPFLAVNLDFTNAQTGDGVPEIEIGTHPDIFAELETYLEQTVEPSAEVTETFCALQQTPLIQEAFEVVGTTEVPLDGERANVRTRSTNLGRLAADSTPWYAQRAFPDMSVDVALKNGGGIRASIIGPNITRLAINTALAFDSQISVVELSATELLAAMENSVSRVPAADGRFPQPAGMHLVFDPGQEGISDASSLDTPSRVRTLQIVDEGDVVDISSPPESPRVMVTGP